MLTAIASRAVDAGATIINVDDEVVATILAREGVVIATDCALHAYLSAKGYVGVDAVIDVVATLAEGDPYGVVARLVSHVAHKCDFLLLAVVIAIIFLGCIVDGVFVYSVVCGGINDRRVDSYRVKGCVIIAGVMALLGGKEEDSYANEDDKHEASDDDK